MISLGSCQNSTPAESSATAKSGGAALMANSYYDLLTAKGKDYATKEMHWRIWLSAPSEAQAIRMQETLVKEGLGLEREPFQDKDVYVLVVWYDGAFSRQALVAKMVHIEEVISSVNGKVDALGTGGLVAQ